MSTSCKISCHVNKKPQKLKNVKPKWMWNTQSTMQFAINITHCYISYYTILIQDVSCRRGIRVSSGSRQYRLP